MTGNTKQTHDWQEYQDDFGYRNKQYHYRPPPPKEGRLVEQNNEERSTFVWKLP